MDLSLNATIIDNQRLNDNLFILKVKPENFQIPDFKPGQFATLGLPLSLETPEKLIQRAYSIASSNTEKNFLEFYIAKITNGKFTPRLYDMKTGDRLWLGPKLTGNFTLDPVQTDKNLWLISTGTGLGPYMSMIRSTNLGMNQKTILVHGVRYVEDLGYLEELNTLSKQREGFSYFPTISRPSEHWKGRTGRIPQLWPSLLKETNVICSPNNSHIFLCGNPDMIKEMTSLLTRKGFKTHSRKEPGQIHTEKYW